LLFSSSIYISQSVFQIYFYYGNYAIVDLITATIYGITYPDFTIYIIEPGPI